MTSGDLMDLLVLERKLYHAIDEARDLTAQLSEAVDRQDEVTVRILLGMRGEAIQRIQEVERNRRLARKSFPPAMQLEPLFRQERTPRAEEEQLAAQIASNRKTLQMLLEMDKRVNVKLTGGKSIYAVNAGEESPV